MLLVLTIMLTGVLAACGSKSGNMPDSIPEDTYDSVHVDKPAPVPDGGIDPNVPVVNIKPTINSLPDEFENYLRENGLIYMPIESDAITISEHIFFSGVIWQVLDVQADKTLIISKDLLSTRVYNSERIEITWEDSDIRQYLNTSFYDSFFSIEEKSLITETSLRNGPDVNDTVDKIFLLSPDEARHFSSVGSLSLDAHFKPDEDGNYYSRSWWLRTPGYFISNASAHVASSYGAPTAVADAGTTYFLGMENDVGVRPALWLIL